jgi:hypothetical protein
MEGYLYFQDMIPLLAAMINNHIDKNGRIRRR